MALKQGLMDMLTIHMMHQALVGEQAPTSGKQTQIWVWVPIRTESESNETDTHLHECDNNVWTKQMHWKAWTYVPSVLKTCLLQEEC